MDEVAVPFDEFDPPGEDVSQPAYPSAPVDFPASQAAYPAAPVDFPASQAAYPAAPVDYGASPALLPGHAAGTTYAAPPTGSVEQPQLLLSGHATRRVGQQHPTQRRVRGKREKKHWIANTWLRRTVKGALVLTGAAALFFGGLVGYAYYRFDEVKKVAIPAIAPLDPAVDPGENILFVGSDAVAPLVAGQGPSGGGPSGENSPVGTGSGHHAGVIMVFHLDLSKDVASVLSIPPLLVLNPSQAATMGTGPSGAASSPVTLDQLFGNGPAALVSAITSAFSLPINHYVGIDYSGIEQMVSEVGGLRLRFPYPARDPYDGLYVPHTGCQTLDGIQALELIRSVDYQFEQGFSWAQDPTGSYGSALRQRTVLGALGSRAVGAGVTNPITGNRFLGSLVDHVTLDSTFSFTSLLSLVNQISSANLTHAATYTFPTSLASEPDGSLVLDYQPASASQVVEEFLGGPPPQGPGGGASGPGAASVTTVPGQAVEPTYFEPSSC